MVTRLVLGCDATGLAVVSELVSRQGELFVLEPDPSRVEQLRNEKVTAEQGDVWDVGAVGSLEIEPDVVFILGDEAEQNLNAARAASESYPTAYLVAYAGVDATRIETESLESIADHVVAPGSLIVEYLEELLQGGHLPRLQALRETIWDLDGTLGIFTHDNPDPDAIASAVALASIAEWFGVEATACYYGNISHQENRALVNLLDYDLRNLDDEEEPEYDHYALVDHSGPGINDQLPLDTDVAIVIDHHPPKTDVGADFVDIRPELGSASTLMVDYIKGYDVPIDQVVATGLLYGIRIDTRDFARNTTPEDIQAAAYLLPKVDTDVLHRVENPSLSSETLDIIGRAIRNRNTRGRVLTSCTGPISDRDALAQAADRLLNLENVDVTLVYGYRDGEIYLSGRSRGVDLDLGETLREAFGDIGNAGGHANMAGAQIPIGLFDEIDEESESAMTAMVEKVVEARFFDVVQPETIEE